MNRACALNIPFEVDSLDDETKRRAHRVDVLVQDFLNNSCLASVVQATVSYDQLTACVLYKEHTASRSASPYPSGAPSVEQTTLLTVELSKMTALKYPKADECSPAMSRQK